MDINDTLVGLVIFGLIGGLVVTGVSYYRFTNDTITVKEKYNYVEVHSSGDSSYSNLEFVLVDIQGRTFAVGYPFWMIFTSNKALYGQVTVGVTYKVTYFGWRIEWLGLFPSIGWLEPVVSKTITEVEPTTSYIYVTATNRTVVGFGYKPFYTWLGEYYIHPGENGTIWISR
jgi:hypothetical protein